ncbi:MAG: DUF433 domain-containing protein [Chitinophagales bacterium]
MKSIRELIVIDEEILGGQPVFKGSRVPVQTLFDHLESGSTIDDFLADFPSVKRTQAIDLLEVAEQLVTARNLEKLYEIAA